jgi:hypothetical protein
MVPCCCPACTRTFICSEGCHQVVVEMSKLIPVSPDSLFSVKKSAFVNNVFQRKVVTFLFNCFINVLMNLRTVHVRFHINLSHPEQPLLHAKQLFNLHNLLHDRLRETTGYNYYSFRTASLYTVL